MRLISWNVNGIRACAEKGFTAFGESSGADIIAVQEVKGSADNINIGLSGYQAAYSFAERRGYSGTGLFYRKAPVSVSYGLGEDEYNHEGRVITAEYDDFYLVNAYVPNSQEGLRRIDFRLGFDKALREHASALMERKGVILTGDLNTARTPLDLKNPKANEGNAGYSEPERESFEKLISTGFTDSFRYLHPDRIEYSWWSYRFHAREKNAGWRIDYFLVSEQLLARIKDAGILTSVYGSDHAPIYLDLDV